MHSWVLVIIPFPKSCGFLPGQPVARLVVTPQEPVVPYGGSVQLNCSLSCPGGTVQWKGLDTNLGSITSFPTHSILHISNAVVATAGTKICQGTCYGQYYQCSASLNVYALPEKLQLEAEPRVLQPGQAGTLRCSARRVYPLVGLQLSWYRGDQALEDTDFEDTETEEELFDIVSTLPLAGEEVGEGVEFRCKVTLSIGQETFTRVASVAVRTRVPTHDPTTALVTTREPGTETNLELAAATEPPSMERPDLQDIATGRSLAPPATISLPGSSTAADSTSPGSVYVVKGTVPSTWTGPSMGTVPACSLRIWSLPPKGTRGRALRIECQARCARNATVRWLRTPVALTEYWEEVGSSSSTLRLDRAEPQHQGHYQCVLLGHRSQAASLQLTVLDGT
ncbi:MADCA protein, partial [Brachypteracias leptosomus]|nr:MADCA protein [Brachypteracias leptosomus]